MLAGAHSYHGLVGIDFLNLILWDVLYVAFIFGIHRIMDDVISQIDDIHSYLLGVCFILF